MRLEKSRRDGHANDSPDITISLPLHVPLPFPARYFDIYNRLFFCCAFYFLITNYTAFIRSRIYFVVTRGREFRTFF